MRPKKGKVNQSIKAERVRRREGGGGKEGKLDCRAVETERRNVRIRLKPEPCLLAILNGQEEDLQQY